jgi:ABC-type antimicrobial peptide transport system permease subunit
MYWQKFRGTPKAFITLNAAQRLWLNLQREPGDDLIPAIADQSVITWGLGKAIGDTLVYTDEFGQELKLKLIGGLAGSIFQGSVIISEQAFTDHFPSISGTRVLLIEAPIEQQQTTIKTLSRSLQDYGIDLVDAAERLAAFKTVENTYLSIFLALGGLGLILGTIGLGVIVMRNVLERRSEWAIMQAMGFTHNAIKKIILLENLLLLIIGMVCGVISAVVAVFPALRSPGTQIPYTFLSLTLAAIYISGVCWTALAIKMALRKRQHRHLLFLQQSSQ